MKYEYEKYLDREDTKNKFQRAIYTAVDEINEICGDDRCMRSHMMNALYRKVSDWYDNKYKKKEYVTVSPVMVKVRLKDLVLTDEAIQV